MSALSPRQRLGLAAAQLLALAPQYDRLPPWLWALAAVVVFWRLPLVERRIGVPGRLVTMTALVAAMAGVWLNYHTLLGPDAGVSFLVVTSLLKYLEGRSPRDAYVQLLLGLFVAAAAFLFEQSLARTVLVLAVIWLQLAGLLLMNGEHLSWRGLGRQAGLLLLQSIPIMVVLFLFFPRLPPLWSINVGAGQGRSGLSNEVSPGDVAKLSQSTELAFRVEFEGQAPASAGLYWRALTLGDYDGYRWRQDDLSRRVWPNTLAPERIGELPDVQLPDEKRAVRYRITMEPTDQPWLFALTLPASADEGIRLASDFRLVRDKPVYQRFRYSVTSWPQARLQPEGLSWQEQGQYLQVPAGNPRARALAQRWQQAATSDADRVRRGMAWLQGQPFRYTLEPPLLGEQRVDDFLFNTRAGFCEHYASSFAFLMRSAGVPARLVVGYQGGEPSTYGAFLTVRQLDAHAWVEVWLRGRGWVQVDPTTAVAPERVEQGVASLAERPDYWGESSLARWRYGQYRWLRQVRQWVDYANYAWSRHVVAFDDQAQQGTLQRWLGASGYERRIWWLAGGMITAMLLLAWWLMRGRSAPLHPADRLLRRLERRLQPEELARQPGEGVRAWLQRLALARPERAAAFREFAAIYSAWRYRPEGDRRAIEWQRRLQRTLRRI